jgi:hypothetical protein
MWYFELDAVLKAVKIGICCNYSTAQMEEDVQMRQRPRLPVGDIASKLDGRASAFVPQCHPRMPMPESKELERRFTKVLVSTALKYYVVQHLRK